MKLSKRLTSLANLVSSSDIVADIGCDHALLDIYLIKNNILPKILVTDINPNALESGKKNILKYHLNDYINAKLSDGINNLDNDINTLIISGMGTNTICNILNNPNIKQINKLIIQSNNNYEDLRKYITNIGFNITYEEVIYDDRYYINMVFNKGYKKYSKSELKYGIHNNKDYLNYLYLNNKGIYKKIPKYKVFRRLELLKEIFELKKLLRSD